MSEHLSVNAGYSEANSFAEETVRRADLNDARIADLWHLLWPWRWPRFWRLYRKITRENRAIRKRIAESRIWRKVR